MLTPRVFPLLAGVMLQAVCTSEAQNTTTIFFDGSGAEAGVTMPGATDFSFMGSHWTGGVVATESFPPLYASGEFSYEISESGGEVTFDMPIDSAEFFFVHTEALAPSPRGGAPAVWLAEQGKVLLFGGMLPITADTWEYDVDSRVWAQLSPEDQGPVPGARCHHTLVSDRQFNGPENTMESLYLFGGFSLAGRFNDVWRYDPAEGSWQDFGPTGQTPARRCLHSAAYIGSRNEMLVYGGVHGSGGPASSYFEDTHILDLTGRQWALVDAAGPGKLRGAIAFYSAAKNAVYLWGGKQVGPYPTTLWRFDVDQRAWAQVPTSGDVPVGREDPAFFWDEGAQMLYIFSGWNDEMPEPLLNDAYTLDLATSTWQAVPVTGRPPARWRPSVAFDDETGMGVMFGGWTGFGGQDALADTWIYDTVTATWSESAGSDFPAGVATALDVSGTPIGSVRSRVATTFADPANFVTLEANAPIAAIQFRSGVIDNFSYSDSVSVPTVSAWGLATMGLLLLAAGTLFTGRSVRGSPQ